MTRYAIQDKMILQWTGANDKDNVRYALGAARQLINFDTVDASWRWLAEDLSRLYIKRPEVAAACFSWCNGWVLGASSATKPE